MANALEEHLQEVLHCVRAMSSEMEEIKKTLPITPREGYTNKELMKMFDVSSATVKKWRDEGYIGYSAVYNTYIYSLKDVKEFLKKTHFDAFRVAIGITESPSEKEDEES